MMGHLKLGTALTAAIILAACSTTDDKFQVGAGDNDQYAATGAASDAELSDEQTFGFNDGDKYEARVIGTSTATPNTAVAGRVIRMDDTILGGFSALPNHSTVASTITSLGLGDAFDGTTEYTVFAPSNDAFAGVDLSGATEMQKKQVIKGHAVAGRIDSATLSQMIDDNGGTLMVDTLSGDKLTFMKSDGMIKVADKNGYTFNVTAADNEFKNGYVHGIDGVLGYNYG